MTKRLGFLLAYFLGFITLVAKFPATAQASQPSLPKARSRVCAACLRAHEEFLASDALRGRGSGTHDELLAITYVASQLRQYGIAPAGDGGGYVQHVSVVEEVITTPPQLSINVPGDAHPLLWTSGKEFQAVMLAQTDFSGALQHIEAGTNKTAVKRGAIVLLSGDGAQVRSAVPGILTKGAAGVLTAMSAKAEASLATSSPIPESPMHVEGIHLGRPGGLNLLRFSSAAFQSLSQLPEGTTLHFTATSQPRRRETWNALGILRGNDPSAHGAVLLSAHVDHLGVGAAVNGDDIYNGADDDASGTTAVLELARVLGRGPRPRRMVIFALFGSEETGGLGSTYFREHSPVPLKDIAANLEVEMIGRRDPSVRGDTLWLTGWERSNLGPELASHGALLVADPHPGEDFFRRSDNYLLALDGVVAQTISSYGLHGDYHQPSDDLAHLDFPHMDVAITSLIPAIEWLVNSDFRPQWHVGGQP